MNKFLLHLLCLFFISSAANLFAQGDLMIMPKRLVFDGSQRSQEINLANTGNDTAVYAISFVNYKMTQDGNFELVEQPEEGQRFATNYLRYFPRRVSLAPNEAQTIRVQLTRTGELQEGEYRSHMYFRAVEEQTALGDEQAEQAEGISINIKTVFGISIPIIIREGQSTTAISLTDINLDTQGGTPKLSLIINRSGNMSVYGNLKIEHIAPNGTQTEIGMIKGISVYTPNRKRNFTVDLKNTQGLNLNSGKLSISYSEENNGVLSSTNYSLNKN